MTPEEACEFLGISLEDEELHIERIEKKYRDKLLEYKDSMRNQAKAE